MNRNNKALTETLNDFLSDPEPEDALTTEPVQNSEEEQTTGEPTGTTRKIGRPKTSDNDTRTSFVVDKTQIAKIRYISETEKLSQKTILKLALESIIARYEAKNGKIVVEEEKARDLTEIF